MGGLDGIGIGRLLGWITRPVSGEPVVEQTNGPASLIGLDGSMSTGINETKRCFEIGLEVELAEHLAHSKHAVEGYNGENSRNGLMPRAVLTDVGPLQVEARLLTFGGRDRPTLKISYGR